MKILFVNHTFPPESIAGSELCVLRAAQELRRRGHDAAVFYRISDTTLDEYALRERVYDGIPTIAINHTYRCIRSFQQIYLNPAIAAKFSLVLYRFRPDVVHFHHLTNLSLSLPQEAKRFGCKTMFTLHDYWLLCQRGQLLTKDLSLCTGPSLEKCRACLAPQLLKHSWLHRCASFAQRFQAARHDPFRLSLNKAKIATANEKFVQTTSFHMGDREHETILAHPPTELEFKVPIHHPSVVTTAIAMHPSTYRQTGGGVWFEIERNGSLIFSRLLNPKRNKVDQGWHPVRVDLEASSAPIDRLVLRTKPESDVNHDFCAAGWRNPRIESDVPEPAMLPQDGGAQEIHRILSRMVDIWIEAAAGFSPRAREGITHRHAWARRVFQDVDLFISPSRFLRDFFIRYGMDSSKIVYLDNGFPPPSIQNSRTPEKPIRFGYIGTWIPPKGIDIALRAFQSIPPDQARLLIYGFFPGYDGFDRYPQVLQTLNSPAVEWRGEYAPDRVYHILSEIDCLIMPSIWWENSPLTLHEAFLARVPVITADVGGMAEMVSRGGGTVFRHRDPESLRHVVLQTIDRPSLLRIWRESIPEVQSLTGFVDQLLYYYKTAIQAETE